LASKIPEDRYLVRELTWSLPRLANKEADKLRKILEKF